MENNKYKKGDFVQLVETGGLPGLEVGMVFEVLQSAEHDDGTIRLDTSDVCDYGNHTWLFAHRVVPFTPVEPASDVPIELYDTVRIKDNGRIGVVVGINRMIKEQREALGVNNLISVANDIETLQNVYLYSEQFVEVIDPDELIKEDAEIVSCTIWAFDTKNGFTIHHIDLDINDLSDILGEV